MDIKMEFINNISFVFLVIAFSGALAFPVAALRLAIQWSENQHRGFVLALLWLILIAVLAGVGVIITA